MNGDGLDAMEPILEADSFCIDPSCLTFFDFIMNNISGSSRPHDIIVLFPKGVYSQILSHQVAILIFFRNAKFADFSMKSILAWIEVTIYDVQVFVILIWIYQNGKNKCAYFSLWSLYKRKKNFHAFFSGKISSSKLLPEGLPDCY